MLPGRYRRPMTVSEVDAGPDKLARSAEVHAPVAELFDVVADPNRHHELDGSGSVVGLKKGPNRLSNGAKFSMKMKRGVPYTLTSTVTEFQDNRVVEWQHPAGHRWRWEFASTSPGTTTVTETYDYTRWGPVRTKVFEVMKAVPGAADGIEKTLERLQAKYAG